MGQESPATAVGRRQRAAALLGCASLAALLCLPTGCTRYYFSGIEYPNRSKPVAKIETRGGTEYGATTTEGILFLGRTAQSGPCRVHYFLGATPTPLVEAGEIRHLGGVFYLAQIDLKTPSVEILSRDTEPSDELVAIQHRDGDTREIPVRFASSSAIQGEVLEWPGEPLAAGTGIFTRQDEELKLVGLVSGALTLEGESPERYLTLAGTDQLREMLAVPRIHPVNTTVVFRPDGITVTKPK